MGRKVNTYNSMYEVRVKRVGNEWKVWNKEPLWDGGWVDNVFNKEFKNKKEATLFADMFNAGKVITFSISDFKKYKERSDDEYLEDYKNTRLLNQWVNLVSSGYSGDKFYVDKGSLIYIDNDTTNLPKFNYTKITSDLIKNYRSKQGDENHCAIALNLVSLCVCAKNDAGLSIAELRNVLIDIDCISCKIWNTVLGIVEKAYDESQHKQAIYLSKEYVLEKFLTEHF